MSSLSMDYDQLARAAAFSQGWGSDPVQWEKRGRLADIQRLIDGGVTWVVNPPAVVLEPGGKPVSHRWSWLERDIELTTVADTETYGLPADFGGVVGKKFYYPRALVYAPIRETAYGRILHLSNMVEQSGIPREYAIRPKPIDPQIGQRWEIYFHPTPSQAWVLRSRIRVVPQRVNKDNPYPPGGPEMGELYRTAVIAFAEEELEQQRGQRYQNFMAELQSRVLQDIQDKAPASVGRNDDDAQDRYYDDAGLIVTYDP